MTPEELLQAIGRVDDDLIQEAEDCRSPPAGPACPTGGLWPAGWQPVWCWPQCSICPSV